MPRNFAGEPLIVVFFTMPMFSQDRYSQFLWIIAVVI